MNRIFTICFISLALTLFYTKSNAQIKVGDNPNTISSASLMELESTNKGFVFPRVSLTGAVTSSLPLGADILAGTVVYNTNAAFVGGIGLLIWTGSAWMAVTPLSLGSTDAWKLTGNSGTNPSTNFIGTTDAQPLVFKVANTQSGKIDFVLSNTSFGYQSLNPNVTGGLNTSVGHQAMSKTTSGSDNTTLGYATLYYNTTGNYNTATGVEALFSNTTGSYNSANGTGSLGHNINGNNNTANGYFSLTLNTTGNNNTANGYYSLYSNTTGNNNTAFGYGADVSSGNLTNATAIGYNAKVAVSNALVLGDSIDNIQVGIGTGSPTANLHVKGTVRFAGLPNGFLITDGLGNLKTTTAAAIDSANWNILGNGGTDSTINFLGTTDAQPLIFKVNNQKAGRIDYSTSANTAFGYQSLKQNTTGAYNAANGYQALAANTIGSNNNAFGFQSLLNNTSGNNNAAYADSSLLANTIGNNNSAFGLNSLDSNTTGNYNVAYGDSALQRNITGSYNTAVGHHAGVTSANLSNATAIGANARVSASNALVLGNNVNVGIGTSSPQAGLHVSNTDILFSASGDIPVTPSNPPTSGASRRTMWYPDKAAFRTGYVSGSQWDQINIGNYSFASGNNTIASGLGSIAMGINSGATADNTIAMGNQATAGGNFSVAIGDYTSAGAPPSWWAIALGYDSHAQNANTISIGKQSYATAANSIAIGNTASAQGYNSTAVGQLAYASGFNSSAFGSGAQATGGGSFAVGLATASGNGSIAIGNNNTASGNGSCAFGYQITAASYNETVVGGFNTVRTGLNATSWVGADPAFVVGTGTGSLGVSSDAFTVLKNGNTGIGATNPTAVLDVNGTVRFETLPNGILTTDALGNLSTTTLSAVNGSNWSLTGNAGTDSTVNFIGTTDAKPLIFKVNNQKAGRVDYSASANTSFGYFSLYNNTTGQYNVANGQQALKYSTTGSFNTANGALSLLLNTTGNNNTATGFQAIRNNTTGTDNVANGFNAMSSNTTGSNNVANGSSALTSNTTGNYNTANGALSLAYNTTSSNNTATGYSSLELNSSGATNTANGAYTLVNNTTGSSNVASGFAVLQSNISGDNNTASGYIALNHNTAGSSNVASGNGALLSNTTGSFNTGYGSQSLYSNISGSNNTAIGSGANVASGNLTNATALGANASVAISNAMVLGNGANVGIGTSSPAYKLDVVGVGSFVTAGGGLRMQGTGVGSHTYIEYYPDGVGSSRSAWMGYGGNGTQTFSITNQLASGDMNLYTGGDLYLTPGSASVVVKGSSGYVGIGTNFPSQKLEINGGSVYANGENTGFLTDVGSSARVGLIKYAGHEGGIWRTSAQDFEVGRVDASVTSLPGSPASFTTDLYVSGTGQVGLGTTAPTAVLDVNGTTRLRGLTTAGIVTTDINGNISSTTAASLSTTASNGLTQTGNNITLGGTLTQTTTINQNSNALVIQGSGTSGVAGNLSNTPTTTGSYMTPGTSNGESFTLSQAVTVTSITIVNDNSSASGNITLNIFNGNGSTPTYSQIVNASPGQVTYTFTTPQSLSAGVSRFEFVQGTGNARIFLQDAGNTYAGGTPYFNGAAIQQTTYDNWFIVSYYTPQSSPTLYAASNGNVGIGTSSPVQPLTVLANSGGTMLGFSNNLGTDKYNFSLTNGGLNLSESNVAGGRIFVQDGGNVGIGTTTPGYKLDVNGNIRCNTLTQTSDIRFKENILPLTNALDSLQMLKPVNYKWNKLGIAHGGKAGQQQIGLIAQEVEKIYPELVTTDAQGYKAVNYTQLTPVLIQAVKEQQKQIDSLKTNNTIGAIQQLSKQNDKLKTENTSMKQDIETLKTQVKILMDKMGATAKTN